MTAQEYITRVLDALPPNMPSRDQIAMELRGLIDERLERGQSMEEVQRQLGDPLALADSYLSALPLEPASFFSRVWAKLLDAGVFVAVAVILACTAWFTLPREVSPFVVLAVVAASTFGNLFARFMRWQFLLRRLAVRLPTIDSLGAFAGSFAFLPVPLYLGQIVARVRLLPTLTPTERAHVVFAAIWERTLDVWALALLAAPKTRQRRAPAEPLRQMGKDPVTEKDLVIKDGRFGPYVTDGETNASLRRGMAIDTLTIEQASEMLAEKRAKGLAPKKATKRAAAKTTAAAKATPAKKATATKATAKKTTAKKTAPKKATAKKAPAAIE